MDAKTVGQRIKAAREKKNLTQDELAALVNISTTHMSVIERGVKYRDWIPLWRSPMRWRFRRALLIDVVEHAQVA